VEEIIYEERREVRGHVDHVDHLANAIETLRKNVAGQVFDLRNSIKAYDGPTSAEIERAVRRLEAVEKATSKRLSATRGLFVMTLVLSLVVGALLLGYRR
jgi:hypothetical protein